MLTFYHFDKTPTFNKIIKTERQLQCNVDSITISEAVHTPFIQLNFINTFTSKRPIYFTFNHTELNVYSTLI